MRYKWRMPSTDASQEPLLTTQEVADALRVAPATVTRWVKEGRLEGIKYGPRTFRFRRSAVDALATPPAEVTA